MHLIISKHSDVCVCPNHRGRSSSRMNNDKCAERHNKVLGYLHMYEK